MAQYLLMQCSQGLFWNITMNKEKQLYFLLRIPCVSYKTYLKKLTHFSKDKNTPHFLQLTCNTYSKMFKSSLILRQS